MCGIAGFFGNILHANHVPQSMLAALRQRGPDGQQARCWDAHWRPTCEHTANALLHTRLAIIDPRPVADQPMSNNDESIWICYNGELYGWADDARTLVEMGMPFHTYSDTEFILRGYEAWGIEGLLPKLRGMFALVIVDRRRATVWCVRDRMGLKPLIYAHLDGHFAFGSTVRSLLPWLPKHYHTFSSAAIDAYLTHRYIPAPHTIYPAIQRLENGHLLEYRLDQGTLTKRRYWYPEPIEKENWLTTLDQAIQLRTVADRPLGIFLSGGIDSSTIAARLSAMGHHHLHTFSAAFPESPYDESQLAATIAAKLGLPNQSFSMPRTIVDDFEHIIADLDEPFADPSSFPSWYLARETAHHVTVVLGGEGGDELLAGYKRHRRHLQTRWRTNFSLPLPILPHWHSKGWRKLLTELSLDWKIAYSLRFSGCTPNQRAFLQPDYCANHIVYWRFPDQIAATPLEQLIALDLANTLPDYILRKADLCTMAHGLELRAPLLDHILYQTWLALPPAIRYTQPPKRLLTEAAPALGMLDLLHRKKRGFNPPLDHWLRIDLHSRLSDIGPRLETLTNGQLNASRINTLVNHYCAGQPLAEQIVQLLILDTSLSQLTQLTRALHA